MRKESPPVAEPTNVAAQEGEGSPFGAILDQVVTLVIAITIALAIRHFLVEPFRIPSGSMFPTLLIGDHLFVNKVAYGSKVPFTDWRLPSYREPQRGDVVVFEVARPGNRMGGRDIKPVDLAPEDAPREDFVKRLVGMPGDRVAWRGGRVYINDVPLAIQSLNSQFVDESGVAFDVSWEDLGDCRHAILDDPRPRRALESRLDRGTWVVEPGRYFMMGDNRDNSNDSRGWGTVRLEEMKGPAFILYWSWDVNGNMLSFFNPVNWFQAEKRWDRVFQRVRCKEKFAG
ncbi:MAG: signal peptidase I [Myxococcales bacterium]|nr:signal peptidase I [Myxococcales bacterium]HIK84583.1 signal peptidase I [Myxococcales bacterium]